MVCVQSRQNTPKDKLLLTLAYLVVQVAWALMVAHEVPNAGIINLARDRGVP